MPHNMFKNVREICANSEVPPGRGERAILIPDLPSIKTENREAWGYAPHMAAETNILTRILTFDVIIIQPTNGKPLSICASSDLGLTFDVFITPRVGFFCSCLSFFLS